MQGIPGDEDGGGMSAFVVFSMMGFYPVTPGIPTYDIGSPVFNSVTIHLKNGKDFVHRRATNSSHDNKYVQSIRLNGKPLNQVWFRHADIANGGTLELHHGRHAQHHARHNAGQLSARIHFGQAGELRSVAQTALAASSRGMSD